MPVEMVMLLQNFIQNNKARPHFCFFWGLEEGKGVWCTKASEKLLDPQEKGNLALESCGSL